MNDEEFEALVRAVFRRRLQAQGGAAMPREQQEALWNSVTDELMALPDSALRERQKMAGEVAPLIGRDSVSTLGDLFSADSVQAFADRLRPRQAATASAAQAAPQRAIPASRQASIDQSPTMRVMRAVPGMTQEYAQAMPRSRQDAILRSDAANTRAPVQGQPVRNVGRAVGDMFNRNARLAQDMDEMGSGPAARFGQGIREGVPMAAHRIVKGGLGLLRGAGGMGIASGHTLYNAYDKATEGFENEYNTVSPTLGKMGMTGEMVGGLPVDLPLYATGTKAVEAIPLLARMLSSTNRFAQGAARIGSNAIVDAGQGALMEAGERNPSKLGLGVNVGMNVGLGAPLNVMSELGGMFRGPAQSLQTSTPRRSTLMESDETAAKRAWERAQPPADPSIDRLMDILNSAYPARRP